MKKIRVRWIIQAVCLVLVWLLKLFPHGGEWYATTIYPVCSGGLACFSSFFPFSLNDLFIYGSWLVFCCICFMRYCGNIG